MIGITPVKAEKAAPLQLDCEGKYEGFCTTISSLKAGEKQSVHLSALSALSTRHELQIVALCGIVLRRQFEVDGLRAASVHVNLLAAQRFHYRSVGFTEVPLQFSSPLEIEEAAMIVSNEDNMAKLCEHFSNEYMSVTGQYSDWLTVRDEAAVAMKHGVAAMHDISEGGIFTALWDFAEGSGCGFEVDLKRIPLRQETVEIAEFFHLNPYTMKSSGSIIIACDNGTDMVNALNEEGIPAVIIGRTTDNNGKILRNEDEIRYLDKM